jgi:methylmalonyl-CoA mutase
MSATLPDIASLFPPSSEAEWRARVDAVLKSGDFRRRLVGRTADGIAVEPLHPARADAAAVPGARGAEPWAVSALADHPDAEAAAAQALEDLEGGSDMLALAFPGGRGARGHGLPCGSAAELEAALAGVRLDLIRLRLDPAPAGRLNALLFAALVERRKLDPASVRVDFGLDPLGSLASVGRVPWDWPAMGDRLAETVTALRATGFPGPFLTVDLRTFHEAGATEGQELAAALAGGVHYVRALEARGIALADAFSALSFLVPVDADQFLGVAKLRALRRLWARVREACEQAPAPAVVHAETSWRMLARRDAHVNILRGAVAAFAAGVGGADTVTVTPFTRPLGLPDAMARRLARNTSIVLMEEAGLWRVADPAAGAGGVEALTDALCAKAWALFQEIEGEGGILVSLVLGKLQARVAAAAAERARLIASRRMPLTGVSEYPDLAETPPSVLPVKPVKATPPKARARAKFGEGTAELVAALAAGASRADAAPAASGGLAAPPLPSVRLAEPWEALRDRSDAFLRRRRRRPSALLATLGPLAEHGGRLQFMRGLFEAGGVAVSDVPAAEAPAGAALVCLVGSDAAYAAEGAKALRRLKAKGRTLWAAGRPADLEEALRKAGARRLVAMGDDMLAALDEALSLAGA